MFFTGEKYKTLTMDEAKRELEENEAIVLFDVRSPEEYAGGHLPHSRNLPVNRTPTLPELVADKNTKIFVYCLSGARSSRACAVFSKLGYSDVTNIGGIGAWTGEIEK